MARVAATAVAVVLIVGMALWLLWPSSDADVPDAPTSASPEPRDTGADAKLLGLVPPGYPEDACEPVDPAGDAVATVRCADNADQGGPPSATYSLLRDKATLHTAFDDVVDHTTMVNCPGNIQSPGPWRRAATPQQTAGTVYCGYRGKLAMVAWTTDSSLLLSDVTADGSGPTLEQLYAWWSMHS